MNHRFRPLVSIIMYHFWDSRTLPRVFWYHQQEYLITLKLIKAIKWNMPPESFKPHLEEWGWNSWKRTTFQWNREWSLSTIQTFFISNYRPNRFLAILSKLHVILSTECYATIRNYLDQHLQIWRSMIHCSMKKQIIE